MKKNIDEKEIKRFKHEYELLSKYNHPNILKAYSYDENENQYIIEYCNFTLKKYISDQGNVLSLTIRKNIALQFLNGIKIIHSNGILHRDISYNNILIKVYDDDLLEVKISDFGLVKDERLDLTSTNSPIKGTIIDDTLESFKDYKEKNEIYAIGVILYFIFTGKQNLNFKSNEMISDIAKKCVDRNLDNRYNSIDEIISDILSINENENKSENSNIGLKNKIIDNRGLSELAVEILKNAVDSNGNIFFLKTLSGTTIQSGDKSYKPNNSREEAELENVIEILENNQYAKPTNYKRDYFKVTKKGYEFFD